MLIAAAAEEHGSSVAEMKRDWRVVFPYELETSE